MQFERVVTRHNPTTAAEVFAAAHATRARIIQRETEARNKANREAAQAAFERAETARIDLEESERRLAKYRLAVHIPRPSEAAETGEDEKGPPVADIITAVCKHFNVSRVDIMSPRREQRVVWPRQVGMYLAGTITKRSLPDIGRRYGGRDHTTVLYAVRKMKAALAVGDEQLAADIAAIKQALGVS
jgi:chromosomal replication initiator protein